MRYRILTAAVPLAIAPAAHAQANDCTVMNAILAAAPGGFTTIKSDEEIDDNLYFSTVQFGNNEECVIESVGRVLYCSWILSTPAEADAQSLFLHENAKFCLSEGWKWTDIAGQKSVDDVPILEGYAMNGSGANKGTRVRIYVEGEPDEQLRQVWVEAFRP